MKDFHTNREIRIFLSSTFQDLMKERDYLVRNTFRRLREIATSRNVILTVLDLRWGITEEESKNGEVVKVCLDEIMNSHPFFIGLIGDRYGWCPSDEEISIDVKNNYSFLNKDIQDGLSITEIEMQFGALRRSNDDTQAAFFVKSNFDVLCESKNQQKFQKFREKVINNGRFPVHRFASINELDEKVFSSIYQLINNLFPEEELTPFHRMRLNQISYENEHKLHYIDTPERTSFLQDFLIKEDLCLCISGVSGIGKTSIISNWQPDSERFEVIKFYVGNNLSNTLSDEILQYFIDYVSEIHDYDLNKFGVEAVNWNLKQKLEKIVSDTFQINKPYLFVIDGINQVFDYNDDKDLGWLPSLPNGCKIVISTVVDDRTCIAAKRKSFLVYDLQPLNESDRELLVQEYLAFYGKKLNEKQLERVVSDKENVNTIVLKTLLDELVSFGSFEKLDQLIDEFTTTDSTLGFFNVVLQNYEKEFGYSFVKDVLSLISLSHYGLAEEELVSILKCTQLQWSHFYCSFKNLLINKSGLINLAHTYIVEAVLDRYLNNENDFAIYCRNRIIREINNSSETDAVSPRKCAEIPYQYFSLNKYEELFSFLTNGVEPFVILYSHERANLVMYWDCLLKNTFHDLSEYLAIDTNKIQNDLLQSNSSSSLIIYSFLEHLLVYTRSIDKKLSIEFANRTIDWIDTYLSKDNFTIESFYYHVYKEMYFTYSFWNDNVGIERSLEKLIEFASELRNHSGFKTAYAECSMFLGNHYKNNGKYDKAKEVLKNVLNELVGIVGEQSIEVSDVQLRLGDVYEKLNQSAEALDLKRKAIETKKALLGKRSPQIPYWSLISSLQHNGKLDEAEGLALWAIDMFEETKDYGVLPTLYSEMGFICIDKAKYENAIEWHTKAYESCKREKPYDYQNILTYGRNLSISYYNAKEYEKGLALEVDLYNLAQEKQLYNDIDISKYHQSLGALYTGLQQYEKAKEHMLAALEGEIKIYGDISNEVALMYNNLAALHGNMKSYEESLLYFNKATDLYDKLDCKTSAAISSFTGKGNLCLNDLRYYAEAASCFYKALQICINLYGESYTRTYFLYDRLGDAYSRNKQYDRALNAYLISFQGYQKELNNGKNYHSSCLSILSNIVKMQVKLGQTEYALTNAKVVYDDYTRNYKEFSPFTATANYLMGIASKQASNINEALEFLTKAHTIMKECRTLIEAEDFINTLIRIAECYNLMEETDETLKYYELALNEVKDAIGKESVDAAVIYDSIGGVYLQDNLDKSLEYCEKGLKLKIKAIGEEHPITAMSYMNRGIIYFTMDKYKTAIEDLQKASSIYEKCGGVNQEYVAHCYDYLGMSYHRLGKSDIREDYFAKSDRIRNTIYQDGDEKRNNNAVQKYIVMHTIPKKTSIWERMINIFKK